MAQPYQIGEAKVLKVDEALGLVFGWAIICTEKGEDYFDLNIDREGPLMGQRVPENIPEPVMLKAAFEFAAQAERPGNEMHLGADKGNHVFMFPLTADIAKALNIQTERTGLLIAYHPPADVLAKFASGDYKGFSIQGFAGGELIDA